MRKKRAKAYKKLMAMYELRFGFRQPYQVLGGFSLLSTVSGGMELTAAYSGCRDMYCLCGP